MGKRANKTLKKLLQYNPNLSRKVLRAKFEKQYTIEARQWFTKKLERTKKKSDCMSKKF